MITFNSEDLFIGYLKQLLASFNLPKYRVYTSLDANYHNYAVEHNKQVARGELLDETWPEEAPNIVDSLKTSYNYLKNNNVQKYINGKWVATNFHYHYNKKEINYTKNLVVKDNTYDSYTHEYLGDYLRFQRDYNHLDLMPLYNCFSNIICSGWEKPITIEGLTTFDTSDTDYKIYMLPVKLFKKYTIAIDSEKPVEICCGYFNKYMYAETSLIRNFHKATYKKYNSLKFTDQVLYNSLYIPNAAEIKKDGITTWALNGLDIEELIKKEQDLKMFIKLPTTCKSSIVVLEGNYLGYGSFVIDKTRSKLDPNYSYDDPTKNVKWTRHENKYITNYETEVEGQANETFELFPGSDIPQQVFETTTTTLPNVEDRDFEPITSLQLLKLNTNVQHPFADRLIEYLLDNVITPLDEINDNVKRAETVMEKNGINVVGNGVWEREYRNVFYDYMHADYHIEPIYEDEVTDSLGYVDKDVEKNYKAYKQNEKGVWVSVESIQNVDIYPDIYLDSKQGGKK